MKVLVQLKPSSAFQGFVSTSYIGELIEGSPIPDDKIHLERVCCLYEVPVPTKSGIEIKTTFYSSYIVSNSILELSRSEVLFSRGITEGDEILVGYEEAMKALEMQKVKTRSGLILEKGN